MTMVFLPAKKKTTAIRLEVYFCVQAIIGCDRKDHVRFLETGDERSTGRSKTS